MDEPPVGKRELLRTTAGVLGIGFTALLGALWCVPFLGLLGRGENVGEGVVGTGVGAAVCVLSVLSASGSRWRAIPAAALLLGLPAFLLYRSWHLDLAGEIEPLIVAFLFLLLHALAAGLLVYETERVVRRRERRRKRDVGDVFR